MGRHQAFLCVGTLLIFYCFVLIFFCFLSTLSCQSRGEIKGKLGGSGKSANSPYSLAFGFLFVWFCFLNVRDE